MKGVNTTIHMGISHHVFSFHCIQVPSCVIVFDQFLSCCCSVPLGIEALFDLILGWKCLLFSWSTKNDAWVVIWTRWVSLESSAILIFLFIVVWLGLERNWFSLFWDQNLSPWQPLGAPLFGPISCHMFFPIFLHLFLTLPPKLKSVFLVVWV